MPSAESFNIGRPGLISLELSGMSASITFTLGAINIWFGRNLDKTLVFKILITISKVDSTTTHEREIICNFNEINDFENSGFILTSYAKKGDTYRAIFIVPFRDQRALRRFVESIIDEMKFREVIIALYWSGGVARMNIMFNELSKLNYFNICNATYKEDTL